MAISTPELKFCAAALCVGMALITSPVHAQKKGCEYRDIKFTEDGLDPFKPAESYSSKNSELTLELNVKYADHWIARCKVHHRSYNDLLTGPTLRLKPGDTLKLNIVNHLAPNIEPEDPSKPHDFNTTNFHTHGLHVDPSGISDNVLRKMEPRKKVGDTAPSYKVKLKIPKDHPPGTFWYHAHVHGSTAIQVSSGMAGALIIKGGLDDVPEIAAATDQILLFQQISYDNNGEIEDFDEIFGFDESGRDNWAEVLKRETTINGQIVPVITMQPGEVQRWRLIHGGIRETLMVHLTGHSLYEISVDGLALGKCVRWDGMPEKRVELQPGYRSDVLVKAGEPGTYWLVDGETPAGDALMGVDERRKILAKVVVEGDLKDMRLPCDQDELKYLVPLNPITAEELDRGGRQKVVFCVCPVSGGVEFTVNGKSFDSEKNIRLLKLGSADEWTLSTDEKSVAANHPFHIHVNPFQVQRKGPDGDLEWIWRDTILVKQKTRLGEQKLPIKIRSRYVRYTGDFVLHCHILDHEDQGMMQVVRIVK
ncbi:MAG: multicopper oxidase family protein [Proteobacteria bacterium]|nr:multicopper oxidase family protein [Pseudomonadota bacterium]